MIPAVCKQEFQADSSKCFYEVQVTIHLMHVQSSCDSDRMCKVSSPLFQGLEEERGHGGTQQRHMEGPAGRDLETQP